ncbi:hypothetical protein [Planococcus halotolerans]|uniref:Glycosyl transferase family 1 domain-containing protein n=1 Tax=Planococcus halotolerans TaxID=2233542 RepID=A0A365L5L1_9BACL|nr:hypothetical protein [Planococcus halotolerans]RAZ80714.1 hypothetical protein DP120_00020 [Planococcus halotolerans]
MKKILMVVPAIDIRIVKFAEVFSSKNYAITIVTDKKYTSTYQERLNKINNLKVIVIYKKDYIPTQIIFDPYRFLIYKKIFREEYEFIYSRDAYISYVVLKLSKKKDNVYVDIADDLLSVANQTNSISKKLYNFIINTKKVEKFVITNAGKVMFVCHAAKTHFLKRHNLDRENTYIVSNAPFFHKQIIKESVYIGSEIKILYTGTIDKGIRDFETILSTDSYLTNKIIVDCYVFNHDKSQYVKEIKEKASFLKNIEINFNAPVKNLNYKNLLAEYQIGIIPHARNEVTDFTIPNKIYDYWENNMLIISSDNPSIVGELNELKQILFYEGENPVSLAGILNDLNNKNFSITTFTSENSFLQEAKNIF